MPSLTHGSDLRLAPTLGPVVVSSSSTPRRGLQHLAEAKFTAVQLDATLAGLRPRELDTSARRDLASTLARSGLTLCGLDFFIPTDHYTDPAHQERAVEAACAACALAGELGRVPVSLNLPIDEVDATVVDALLGAASGSGTTLMLHSEGDLAALQAWLKSHDPSVVMAGFDPSAMLATRADPVAAVQSLGAWLGSARLSDAARGQGGGDRVAVGSGDLDLLSYRVSVDLAPARRGPVVLDLRGLANPLTAAQAAQSAWDRAAMKL